MKINKILFKIIILTISLVICSSYICFASSSSLLVDDGGGGSSKTSVQGDDDLGLPTLDSDYRPKVEPGGTAIDIISSLLGVLIVVGVIAVVISIALIGFETILGSASEKAEYQQKLVGVVIAGIFMIAGSTIAKLIISVAESVG